ncbi:MAG TPA: RsmE family RNA methyltransferase [Candidatus Acidoferrales bacterium]|nr:RsmE family RNA methyltransferase [Candidatus Acidoferrales bacterium]
MRRRFFVERFDGRRAVLEGDAAHHAARVLRAAPGQMYELSDGRAVWLARVTAARGGAVEFELAEPVAAQPPAVPISLLLAIVKFDRFEWALEKATELGAAQITPLAAARSEKALVAAAAKRAARWQKILTEAAQQSRQMRAPVLHPATRADDAFRAARSAADAGGTALLFFSEFPGAPPLRSVLGNRTGVRGAVIAIGPEGGWTEEERSAALAAGFAEAGLGPTILRTETAVAAALGAVIYALADS